MREEKGCLNCGKEFQPEWGAGSQRKFCSDPCRIEWWTEYRKANPSEEPPAKECAFCGATLTGKRVRLVCGTTSMCTGLDGLLAIIRYHPKLNPYDEPYMYFATALEAC